MGTNTNTPKYSDTETCGHKYKYHKCLDTETLGTNTNTPKYSDRDTCGHKYKYTQVLRYRNMWAQVLIPPSTRIQNHAKYTHTQNRYKHTYIHTEQKWVQTHTHASNIACTETVLWFGTWMLDLLCVLVCCREV